VKALVADAVVAQTAGSGGLMSFAVTDANDAARRRASHLLRGYLWRRANEWEFRGLLQEAGRGTESAIVARAGSPLAVARQAASRITGTPLPYTQNEAAAEWYARALAGAQDSAALLEKAARLDPGFGRPALLLARRKAAAGDRDGALAALRPMLEPSGTANPVVRLQGEALRAALEGDAGAQFAAAERLADLLPHDAEMLAQFGGMVARKGDFARAAEYYRRALAAEPDVPALWNETAYVQSFAGDLNGALKSLAEYDRVSGKSPNAADSLGEIQFAHGNFREARRAFLDAYDRGPSFLGSYTLRKAGLSAYFAGDRAAAAADFERYADAVARNPVLELSRAQWAYLTASREQALRLITAACAQRNLALACAQQAVWIAAAGGDGRPVAARAQALARNPIEARWAALASFVSQPDEGAAGWERRAGGNHPALIYALLMHRHFAAAIPVLEAQIARTRALESGEWRYLLGWAKLETGARSEAAGLLARLPFPRSSPDAQFEFLVFATADALRNRPR